MCAGRQQAPGRSIFDGDHPPMRGPRRFPWSGREVPHAILDVGRGCDCRCRACYNSRHSGFHDLKRLKHDLKTLCRLRRLHTITLAGGEPLLHPQISDLIRLTKQYVPYCTILTNGIRLNDSMSAHLAQAGLDAVFLHIDAGQERNDLPQNHTAEDRNHLRAVLSHRCRTQGLEVGLEVTVYNGGEGELRDAIRLLTREPDLRYLLVTLCSDLGAWKHLRGSVDRGFSAEHVPTPLTKDVLGLKQVMLLLLGEGLLPLSFLGSSQRGHGPRWLGFGRVVRHLPDGTLRWRELRPTLLSDWMPRIGRILTGRYPFFLPRSRWRSAFLSPFVPGSGGEVLDKWLVIQEGPRPDGRGGVVHCAHCPDAVTLGGHLVPVCLSDAWTPS